METFFEMSMQWLHRTSQPCSKAPPSFLSLAVQKSRREPGIFSQVRRCNWQVAKNSERKSKVLRIVQRSTNSM